MVKQEEFSQNSIGLRASWWGALKDILSWLGRISIWIARILVFLILAYKRVISPLLPQACRFYPTCSCYAILALQRYGIIKGMVLSMKRLIRCGPWHPGGYDPVP